MKDYGFQSDYGFQPDYSYSPLELELDSRSGFLSIQYQGEEIHHLSLPQKLHQQYFKAYKKQVETKLYLLKPYLSGVESFLAMSSGLIKQREIEIFVKREIYRL